jgi:hypothetical protein
VPTAGEADVPDIVRIINAEYAADGVDERQDDRCGAGPVQPSHRALRPASATW